MLIRDTIPIVFSVGSYGTYLEWALTTLTSDNEIQYPFTDTGSSHLFVGNQLYDITQWQQYIKQPNPGKFVRLHPKEYKNDSIISVLELLLETTDRMIHLYPDKNSCLLVINNWASKVDKDWWGDHIMCEVSADTIYKNWPVCQGTPLDQIPVWVKRELLSYYLMPAWQAQVEWYLPDVWQNDRCAFVLVKDLLYDFENCIMRIKTFGNLIFKRDIAELLPYHQKMLELQKFQMQDTLCDTIVNSTIQAVLFDWAKFDIPLISQSWIQWRLRNLGYEIKCHGLDLFPTNSVQLKELLYPINNDKSIP